jgi:nitric oxide reductase activation protein
MSWEERLFGRLYRTLTAGHRRARSASLAPHAAMLAALAPRLRVLACALVGADLEVEAAEDGGGVRGRRLLLPASVALAPTLELNIRIFLARVAYAAASVRLGFTLPATAAPAAPGLWTLLAVPATRDACCREFAAARALHAELAVHVLAARPDVATLAPADAALEALAQLHLGRAPAALAGRVRSDVLTWAEAAAALAPGTTAALQAAAERLRGDFGPGRLAPVALWGDLLPPPAEATAAAAPTGDTPSATGTEREAQRRPEELRVVELGEKTLDENPAVHSFEKVHTAEEYRGGKKRVDGEDELADHADALDELDLREVVRSNERARSLYRADVLLDGGVGDLEGATPALDAIPYDEWDGRTSRYRTGWCSLRAGRLHERRTSEEAMRWFREAVARHRPQIRALRLAFARLEQARAWKGRQPDGPDIDVDALVHRHAALQSGHVPPDRLYCARRRHGQDFATLVLLDASLSTDSWVAGRRVLDVARDSVLVLGEALATLPITVGIAAFASHTRRDCRFLTIKGFSESWADGARRLASVEPAGYTRIGTALRHAIAVLERVPARRRFLLLVSDGKPTDYDRYEGRYGVADVRQAVREAHQRSVQLFALAVDAEARFYLPRMFGHGNYAILPRPDALAGALARVMAEVVR